MITPQISTFCRSPRSAFRTSVALISILALAACEGGGATGAGGKGGKGNDTGDAGDGGQDAGLAAICEVGCPAGYICTNGVCSGGPSVGLNFDVTTYSVSGTVSVDGQTPQQSCVGDQVPIHLRRWVPRDPPWSPLGTTALGGVPCNTNDGAFTARAPSGKYVALAAGELSPVFYGGRFVADPALEINGPLTGVNWALTTVPIGGTILVNGKPPLPNATCFDGAANLDFMSGTGAWFRTKMSCTTTDGAWSARAPQGTYDVLATSSYSDIPAGAFSLKSGFAVDGPVAGEVFTIEPVNVSGTLVIDGQLVVPDCMGGPQTTLTLEGERGAGASWAFNCLFKDGSWSVAVAPGTYRVVVRVAPSPYTPPYHIYVAEPKLVINKAKSGLTWSLATVPISGTFLVDGAPAISAAECTEPAMAIWFTSKDGASFRSTIDCQGTWNAHVPPGTWRVSTSWYGGQLIVVEKPLVVNAAQTDIALSVATVAVGGTIKIDGEPASSCAEAWDDVQLSGALGSFFTALVDCTTGSGAWSARVPADTYEIAVSTHLTPDTRASTISLVDAIEIQ